MLTVAKSVDAPIKLMFPYNLKKTEAPQFSMLGLGDIVIPGIFVALCLKYDIDRRVQNAKNMEDFKTPYFNWCFFG
jgi:minor histocompatibility antigen H13